MDREKFKEYAKGYNVIPVYEMIPADLLTPVLAYLTIPAQEFSFRKSSANSISSGQFNVDIEPLLIAFFTALLKYLINILCFVILSYTYS